MATGIKTWEIIGEELKEINTSLFEAGLKEREHLEQWIKTNPKILGEDILLIGEQVYTDSGPLDFLGIDSTGNTVIIELKRDQLPRVALTQVIDYASMLASWNLDKLNDICLRFNGQALEDCLAKEFGDINLEDLVINQAQRLLLVGFSIESSLNRMIEWLSSNYDLSINAIILKYIKTSSGDALLSKTAIIAEEVEKAKTDKKKFKILMSDEPGDYSDDKLQEYLVEYLKKDLYSSRRIKNILLPLLLEKEEVSRAELKKEFVNAGEAEDESQAGYFLSLISNQLGQKKKDYLRQIIDYKYPNFPWEKDNFVLKDEYKELVKKILDRLNEELNTNLKT